MLLRQVARGSESVAATTHDNHVALSAEWRIPPRTRATPMSRQPAARETRMSTVALKFSLTVVVDGSELVYATHRAAHPQA